VYCFGKEGSCVRGRKEGGREGGREGGIHTVKQRQEEVCVWCRCDRVVVGEDVLAIIYFFLLPFLTLTFDRSELLLSCV